MSPALLVSHPAWSPQLAEARRRLLRVAELEIRAWKRYWRCHLSTAASPERTRLRRDRWYRLLDACAAARNEVVLLSDPSRMRP